MGRAAGGRVCLCWREGARVRVGFAPCAFHGKGVRARSSEDAFARDASLRSACARRARSRQRARRWEGRGRGVPGRRTKSPLDRSLRRRLTPRRESRACTSAGRCESRISGRRPGQTPARVRWRREREVGAWKGGTKRGRKAMASAPLAETKPRRDLAARAPPPARARHHTHTHTQHTQLHAVLQPPPRQAVHQALAQRPGRPCPPARSPPPPAAAPPSAARPGRQAGRPRPRHRPGRCQVRPEGG